MGWNDLQLIDRRGGEGGQNARKLCSCMLFVHVCSQHFQGHV